MTCDRCDRTLPDGDTRYVLTVRMTADFDGHLPEGARPGESLDAILEQCAALPEDELNAQVDLALAFTVCPPCRAVIVNNPLQRTRKSARGDSTGQIQ
jgi:hypothetical protein